VLSSASLLVLSGTNLILLSGANLKVQSRDNFKVLISATLHALSDISFILKLCQS
jgi:hypothetical protein